MKQPCVRQNYLHSQTRLKRFARKSAIIIRRGCVLAFVFHAGFTHAQSFPVKAVRITVPFAAGGGVDITARLFAQALADRLLQPILVENRPSATGISALEYVAKSAPDGYNLLISTQTTQAVVPAMYENLSYDAARDFAPITHIANAPLLIVINPTLPIRSINELIAYARSSPAKLTFGAAQGATTHLAAELFKRMANVQLTLVPYKGDGPAVNDAIGGHISMVFASLPVGLAQVKSGKLRVLAITSAERVVTAPDIPTVNESGLSGYQAGVWFGLFAPSRTPAAIINKLSQGSIEALSTPLLRERMAANGIFAVGNSSESFASFLKVDIPRWASIVKEIGLKPE